MRISRPASKRIQLTGRLVRLAFLTPSKFECIGRGRTAWFTKLNSGDPADWRDTKEAPHGTYVLHRPGGTQVEDQLLRAGQSPCGAEVARDFTF